MPSDRLARAMERVADALEQDRRERARREADERIVARARTMRPMRRLGWGHFLHAVPGLASHFREVPETYFVIDDDGCAHVKCPCGQSVVIPDGAKGCDDCDRFYLHAANHVVATRIEDAPPGAAS